MVKLSNLYKIGKNNIGNRGKIGKVINKIGNNRNFHIVNIDTEFREFSKNLSLKFDIDWFLIYH